MDEIYEDEDITHLEDTFEDNQSFESASPGSDDSEPIHPDTPLYRLRLDYSHETFLASYEEGDLVDGSLVLVSTRYGKDLAELIGRVSNNAFIKSGEIVPIERPASESDIEKSKENKEKETEAFQICKQKIDAHHLEMKLVSVHYLLEEAKILFFFTAENRVDFRELVKDLVSIFKMRIELRQIGVRDESRVVGGLGVCGRGYCCHTVSDKLRPVSIKMAKDQNLSLNSMKISGPCGRLLCCLAYEHTFYNEQRKQMPSEGSKINYQGHIWKVIEVNPVVGMLRLAAENGAQISLPHKSFARTDGRWRILDSELPEELSESLKNLR